MPTSALLGELFKNSCVAWDAVHGTQLKCRNLDVGVVHLWWRISIFIEERYLSVLTGIKVNMCFATIVNRSVYIFRDHYLLGRALIYQSFGRAACDTKQEEICKRVRPDQCIESLALIKLI